MSADYRAHAAVQAAVAAGTLPPVTTRPCDRCRAVATCYHHHSYARADWLNVSPLCDHCHAGLHPRRATYPLREARTVRLPVTLWEALEELGGRENRSVNGTIKEAVERYLRARHVNPLEQEGDRER